MATVETPQERVEGPPATIRARRLVALDPDAREGEMSRRLASLVNYHACARAAERAGLPAALRLSASATKVGARRSDAVIRR